MFGIEKVDSPRARPDSIIALAVSLAHHLFVLVPWLGPGDIDITSIHLLYSPLTIHLHFAFFSMQLTSLSFFRYRQQPNPIIRLQLLVVSTYLNIVLFLPTQNF